MVGGEAAQVERARPYLEAYGTTITHVGPPEPADRQDRQPDPGRGHAARGGEALLLAQAGGLDLGRHRRGQGGRRRLVDAGQTRPADGPARLAPRVHHRPAAEGLRLALEAADELGVPCRRRRWCSSCTGAAAARLGRGEPRPWSGAGGDVGITPRRGTEVEPEPVVLRDCRPGDAYAMATSMCGPGGLLPRPGPRRP